MLLFNKMCVYQTVEQFEILIFVMKNYIDKQRYKRKEKQKLYFTSWGG